MNFMTLTDADHGGLIEVRPDDTALLNALKLSQAKAEARELERERRGQQVPAVERRAYRGRA